MAESGGFLRGAQYSPPPAPDEFDDYDAPHHEFIEDGWGSPMPAGPGEDATGDEQP